MKTKPTKYTKELTDKIYELIESDDYTIAEICINVGISEALFYKWKVDYRDFRESIKKADKKRLQYFAVEARKSMLKKIQGYDYEETHATIIPSKDENGKGILKEQKKIKKHIPPDSMLLMYVLNNTDPENFKHKSHNEITGKDGEKLFESMTDKDKQDIVRKIQDANK